jgi:long-chain acyl-CoA synthetase
MSAVTRPVLVRAADSERSQRRAAAALAARGARRGDRVAVVADPTTPAYLAVAIGALRSGVVPVLVNHALTGRERTLILDDAMPLFTLDDVGVVTAAAFDGDADLAPVPLARAMMYTSGTTGRPKGVWTGVLPDADAQALVDEERELWGFCGDDTLLIVSPLHHSAPLRFSIGVLLEGGDVVLAGGPAAMAEAIEHFHPSTAFVAPVHLQRLFEAADATGRLVDLSSFHLVAHAGAPCPAPLKERAIEAFPDGSVWEFYGSTEGQFTACPTGDWIARPGTVGRARPGRNLSTDPDGTIWCRVPRHARFEYWRDPARTAVAWRGDAFTVHDLGRLDDDGFLYLDGRRDDLIISGGVNVYPLEVEQVLAAHPGVTEVAVFPVDDEHWGQRVVAAVVGSASDAELASYLAGRLAPYKRPKAIVRVDALPHSPTGKLRRSTLARDLGVDG